MNPNTVIADNDRAIGVQIRQRRILFGMTQEGLAKRLGVSHQQVQKYESGQNRVSAGRLLMISKVLDWPVWCFFPTDPNRTPFAPKQIPEIEASKQTAMFVKEFQALSPERKHLVRRLVAELKETRAIAA